MFILSSVVIWNTASILIALGQPIQVSIKAGEFVKWMLPGTPFLYIYELIRKVAQSRNEVIPMLVATIVCNLVNAVLGYYLVRYTTWGWMGAAFARSIGNMVTVPSVIFGMVMGWGERDESNDNANKNNGSSAGLVNNGWDTQQYLEVDSGRSTHNTNDNSGPKENDKEFLHHLWQGFVLSEALSWRAIIEFLHLGLPGMLQVMFEW